MTRCRHVLSVRVPEGAQRRQAAPRPAIKRPLAAAGVQPDAGRHVRGDPVLRLLSPAGRRRRADARYGSLPPPVPQYCALTHAVGFM